MSSPISIFLCHRKVLTREEDGRTNESENDKASVLYSFLDAFPEKYDPWIDESDIATGMEWETKIYSRLLVSDVLMVAIGPGTSKSEWVRREIALATAFGITVFPIGYDLSPDQFGNELRGLGIDRIQGHLTQNIKASGKQALLAEIGPALQLAAQRTAKQQKETLAPLTSRRNPSIPKAPDKQKAFTVPATLCGATMDLHVASGDLTRTRGIDVLVNSENDYMQMARFFERRTVSSLLRRRGARVTDGRYIDAIQQELDLQLGDRARPVRAGDVFVTSAGIPDSLLATDNKARYVFHVAAVQAIDAEARVVPFKQPYQIEECIRSCFKELRRLNELKGVVSPSGTDQHAEQGRIAQNGNGLARSILFPLFGTGQAGSSALDAITHMLTGMSRFFDDPDNAGLASDLTDVYFAAYTQPDTECVIQALETEFSK